MTHDTDEFVYVLVRVEIKFICRVKVKQMERVWAWGHHAAWDCLENKQMAVTESVQTFTYVNQKDFDML